jgi:hypothetical protein
MQNEYILPDNAEESVLQGMLKVASAVGANGRDKDFIRNKVSIDVPSENSIRNKLYIGTIDNWADSLVPSLPTSLSASEGFLAVEDNKVLITGKDEIGLDKAVEFFSNRTYLDQILEEQLIIVSNINDNDANDMIPNETGFYRFKDFGYETVNLKGAFHQRATFYFRQPSGIVSGEESYVNLKFAHSKALLSDNSLLTIYFNNVACDSVKLSASNAEGGNLKVKIPKDVRSDETIEIRIEVYNYLGKIDCSKDFSDTAWTVIDKGSEIYFEPNDKGVIPTLRGFPYFSRFYNNANSDVLIGMPTYYDTELLNIISILSTRMGQMSGNAFDYLVSGSSDIISKNDRNRNMIFIGSFDELRLPEEISRTLGVVPHKESFLINNKLALSSEVLKSKMIFQVARSPWNFDKKIYVIAYDKSIQTYVAKFLEDRKLFSELDKQISIVDIQGGIVNYTFEAQYTEEDNKVPLTLERIKYVVEENSDIPLWILSIGVIFIFIGVLILIKVIRNKGRFKKAAENIGGADRNRDENYSNQEDDKLDDE